MKNLLVALVLVLTTSMVSAQESKFMAGAGLNYATEIKNVGINIKGLYLINDQWEADAGFTYFFKKNYINWSALDFNGHYVLSNNDGTTLYALAGLNMTFYKFDFGNLGGSNLGGIDFGGSESEYEEMMEGGYGEYMAEASKSSLSGLGGLDETGSEIGINIGIGGRMPISDKLSLTGEIKYTLVGADYLSAGIGVMYSF